MSFPSQSSEINRRRKAEVDDGEWSGYVWPGSGSVH